MNEADEMWIDSYLSGEFSDREKGELAHRIDTDPVFREAFVTHVEEWTDLAEISSGKSIVPFQPRRRAWWVPAAFATAAAVALAWIWIMRAPQGTSTQGNTLAERAVLGRVIATNDLQIVGKYAPSNVGDPVTGASMRCTNGSFTVRLEGGAMVSLAAPAIFRIIDGSTIRVEQGKLSGFVPDEDMRLIVLTPGMQIEDLGTRFGVSVDGSKATDLHVFEGKVELTSEDGGSEVLTEGHAIRHETGQPWKISAISLNWEIFPKSPHPSAVAVPGKPARIEFNTNADFDENFVELMNASALSRNTAGELVMSPERNHAFSMIYNPGALGGREGFGGASFSENRQTYGGALSSGAFSVRADARYERLGNGSIGFYVKAPVGESNGYAGIFRIFNEGTADFRVFNNTQGSPRDALLADGQTFASNGSFSADTWYSFKLEVTDLSDGAVEFVGSIWSGGGALIHRFEPVLDRVSSATGANQVGMRINNNTGRAMHIDNFEISPIPAP